MIMNTALRSRPRILSCHVNNLSPLCHHLRPQRTLASRRAAALGDDHDQDEELSAARNWLAKLDVHTIPRHLCDVSFSRSGGPGGQHVNKYGHYCYMIVIWHAWCMTDWLTLSK